MTEFFTNNADWFIGFGIGSILGVVVAIACLAFTEDDECTCSWRDSYDD